MALWTDYTTPTVGELNGYESGLFNVATAEGIDLDSKIELAREEVSIFLRSYLQAATGAQLPDLGAVVLTPSLRRLASMKALALIYRDAHFGQMSERYKNKWSTYAEESDKAQRSLSIEGLGMAATPVPKPAKPSMSTSAGSLAARAYFAVVTWIGLRGDESAASDIASIAAPDGHELVLTPPAAPAGVAGYFAYVGDTPEDLHRQQVEPSSPEADWTLASGSLSTGAKPGPGQGPEYFVKRVNVLPRG